MDKGPHPSLLLQCLHLSVFILNLHTRHNRARENIKWLNTYENGYVNQESKT